MSETLNERLEALRDLAASPVSKERTNAAWEALEGWPAQLREVGLQYAREHLLLEPPPIAQAVLAARAHGLRLDPDTIIAPGFGVGPIQAGIKAAWVEILLGEPDEITSFNDSQDYWAYLSRGLTLMFKSKLLVTVFVYSDRLGGYEKGLHQAFKGATLEGIHIDSLQKDVTAAYGEPDNVGEMPMAPIPSRWVNYKGISFDFIVESGAMIYMSVGT